MKAWPDKHVLLISAPWNLFHKPPDDIAKLLEVYREQNSAAFLHRDADVTDYLVRKAIQAERWRRRLRVWTYVFSAGRRRLAFWHALYRQHLHNIWKRLEAVAKKEEEKQHADEIRIVEESYLAEHPHRSKSRTAAEAGGRHRDVESRQEQ